MRAFFSSLLGLRFKLRADAVPQYNIFKPGSGGIPTHTDFHEKVGAVSILQLTEDYQPGRGGELVLYRQDGRALEADRVISPIRNTLTLFQVGRRSFHSVTEMHGDWTRRTIHYDWLTAENVSSAV